jgi:hypothetical protein
MGLNLPTRPDALGLSSASGGGHSARSMMFHEMRSLVQTMPIDVTKDDFGKAIVGENVLEKPTLVSREKSLRHLTELYGLDTSKALFRIFCVKGGVKVDHWGGAKGYQKSER